MLIANNTIFNLEHRGYFLEGNDSLILSASREGNITIINLKDSSEVNLNLGKNIRDASFSVSQNIISVIEEKSGNLTFLDFQGNLLSTEEPPKFESNFPETINYSFLTCYFDHDEKHFWCVVLVADCTIEIQLRQADGGSILDKIIIEDPFGDSFFSFHPTNKPNFLALWIAAGQDGQEIHWLENIGNKIHYQKDSIFCETTPPAFSPKGTDYLILDDENAISHYQYPTLKIGSCEWDLDEDDIFGYYMDYLNDNLALVSSNEGRVFLLNVGEMKIVDELMIENHEPRSSSHYYPSLKDTNPCTDLLFFNKLEGNFVFVYRRDKNTNSRDWKDSLIVFSVEKILREIALENPYAVEEI